MFIYHLTSLLKQDTIFTILTFCRFTRFTDETLIQGLSPEEQPTHHILPKHQQTTVFLPPTSHNIDLL